MADRHNSLLYLNYRGDREEGYIKNSLLYFINNAMLELNFCPFPEITTARLLLRRMTQQDAGELFFLRSNEHIMKYIDRPRATSLKDAEEFLGLIDKSLEVSDGITWGISISENP